MGLSDEKGHYELRNIVKGKESIGAAIGANRVVIEEIKRGNGTPIPPAYASPSTTPLSKEVKANENTIDIDVK